MPSVPYLLALQPSTPLHIPVPRYIRWYNNGRPNAQLAKLVAEELKKELNGSVRSQRGVREPRREVLH
jgi:hypothetical protein